MHESSRTTRRVRQQDIASHISWSKANGGRTVTQEIGARMLDGSKSGAPRRLAWQGQLRERIVNLGIQAMCGGNADVSPAAAADIPLIRAGLRYVRLRLMEKIGRKSTIATSSLGHRFVCHIGEIAEFPYYHRRALAPELALCAAWLRDESSPVIFDVGANVGYFSTQLAQMLAALSPKIYSFEPVPTTFAKLLDSVQQLDLHALIEPVAAAVLDDRRTVGMAYSDLNSLFSQVAQRQPNARAGNSIAYVPAVSLDTFCSQAGRFPVLVKIDVEGSEAAVLRGARQILSRSAPPAIVLEFSPVTLAECGETVDNLRSLLCGYSLHYIDDIVGQKRPYGSPVTCLDELRWTCNLLAIARQEGLSDRCSSAFEHARRTLQAPS